MNEAMSWQFVIGTLINGNIAGYAYRCLFGHSAGSFPDHVIKALKPYYTLNKFSNVLLLQEASTILDRLRKGGVDCIVLKGMSLLETTYQDIGARKMGDIDLLVKPIEAQKAIQLIESLGYERDSQFEFDSGVQDLSKIFGERVVRVDLSWKFHHSDKKPIENNYLISDLINKSSRVQIAGSEALVLPLPEQIVHIASHISIHHELAFPSGLLDILMLNCTSPDLNWNLVYNTAKSFGLGRHVSVVTGILHDLFGIAVSRKLISQWRKLRRKIVLTPSVIFLDRLHILRFNHVLSKSAAKSIQRNAAGVSYRVLMQSSSAHQIRMIRDIFHPTKRRLYKTYRVKSASLIWFLKVFHVPISLTILIIAITLVPIYSLGIKKRLGARIVS